MLLLLMEKLGPRSHILASHKPSHGIQGQIKMLAPPPSRFELRPGEIEKRRWQDLSNVATPYTIYITGEDSNPRLECLEYTNLQRDMPMIYTFEDYAVRMEYENWMSLV
jgi:hypothetical protein